MEREACTFSYCEKPAIVEKEVDLLIIGGGMGACGAAYEAVKWAKPHGLSILLVDKAALERSGAVAQGLSAINTYIGRDNKVEDYVRMVRTDLMGIIREDLVFDLGRHVDDSVHLFEKWGLPIWKAIGTDKNLKLEEGGVPRRTGRWQVAISGESYKCIVAEAAKSAMASYDKAEYLERVFIVKLLLDSKEENRVAAAAGFSVRENKVYFIKAKAIIIACGGAVHIYRPRSVLEGMGRAWYPVWNAGSTYAMPFQIGAEATMMENRFVPARFKDGYGPVGTWFLLFKATATNARGEDYCAKTEYIEKYAPYNKNLGTCIRNHMMIEDFKRGLGPMYMNTDKALAELAKTIDAKHAKELESEAWEDFLDMTVGQVGVWLGNNIEPDKMPSEIMPAEPYLLGSHAGCCGLWVCGPEDLQNDATKKAGYVWEYKGKVYNRMTTVNGLFTCGDGVGASGHKFSSGSHAEGRIAAKSAVKFILNNRDYTPSVDKTGEELAAEIYAPMELFEKYKTVSTTPYTVNPQYITPKQFLFRLNKIMDEYVAGTIGWYSTSETLLTKALYYMELLEEDSYRMAAWDLHQLMRAWENYHRFLTARMHLRHILFRQETRYPGYYYREDFNFIDDANWKCFVNSKMDPKTGEIKEFKREYVQLIPD